MPIRKKGNVEIQTSANGTKTKSTGFTFYSYDKKSAALYFQFKEEDGEPTDLADATIRLVFVLNDEKITPKTDDIEIWLAVPGTARYIIPESMLGHEGKVTGYVYLEFSDGSHTDEGRFTFEIKQSMITDMLPEAGDKYVQDFEDVKERVEQAGDSATKDIEKAKDDAESQIGDYVGEVESAKQDISSSASDVQSKASEANEDILNLVKSTEDARDNAVKTMNELDYSDRNLIVSSKLNSFNPYSTQPVVKDNGKKISINYRKNEYKLVTLKVDGWKPPEGKYTLSGKIEINGEPVTQETFTSKRIHSGHPNAYNERFEILSDGTIIATERFTESDNGYILHTYFEGLSDGDTITFYDLQFQPGSVPTLWQPAFGDYDAKIKRLENAITNLGGSI